MKNVLMYALLFGLFIVTTAETCDDCDEVCLEELESCALEAQSLEFQNQTLNVNLDFIAEANKGILAGKLCPPPCKGPNPCDICTGCNLATCLFFVSAQDANATVVTIRDGNQNLLAQTGQPITLSDNNSYLEFNIQNQFPSAGKGVIEVTTNNQTVSYPFDFSTN